MGGESQQRFEERLGPERTAEFYAKFKARKKELRPVHGHEAGKLAWAEMRQQYAEEADRPAVGEADAADFERKPPSVAGAVEIKWVGSVLHLRDVKPADAPSSAAFAMLKWCQASAANQRIYWEKIACSILPSRSQIETGGRGIFDPGIVTPEFIDKVQEAADKATREGLLHDKKLRAEVKAELRAELAEEVRQEMQEQKP